MRRRFTAAQRRGCYLSDDSSGLSASNGPGVRSLQFYAIGPIVFASVLQVLTEADLSEFGQNCDLARKWYGDAVFYFGLSAGYYGLAFEFWPDYSLSDAADATDQAHNSLSTGIDYQYLCAIGE